MFPKFASTKHGPCSPTLGRAEWPFPSPSSLNTRFLDRLKGWTVREAREKERREERSERDEIQGLGGG